MQDVSFYPVTTSEDSSSEAERLSVCLKYAEQLEIKEPFYCILLIAQRLTAGIVETMNKGLETREMKKTHTVAQSYNGASVMSARISAARQGIKETQPYTVHIHCLAH